MANNIEEYLEIITEIKSKNKEIWYRGMSNANYLLIPSLFREKRIIGTKYSGRPINGIYYRKSDAIMKSDIHAIEEFIKHYKEYYTEKCKSYNLIDYLYIMQHYDIPTRLLDFSKNELIALYFSVSTAKMENIPKYEDEMTDFFDNKGYSEKGSSIHCIDPVFTNDNTNGFINIKDKILNIDDIDKKNLLKIDYPLCIETNNNEKRIKAQNSVFMLFGSDYKGYEEYDIFSKNTTKIFIPNSLRFTIKKELKEIHNIYHATVYPDIKGIALEIIDQIETKYKNDCKKIFG